MVIPALFDKSSHDIKGVTLEKVICVKCTMKEKTKKEFSFQQFQQNLFPGILSFLKHSRCFLNRARNSASTESNNG